MFQDALKNFIQNIKTSALWIFFQQQSQVVLSFSRFFSNFSESIFYINCKDSPFDSSEDPPNDRRTNTGKKWRRNPLFKVIILLNSVGFITMVCRVDPKFQPSITCGYLKNQFNHRNITFKYIFIFTFNHRCVIDKLIFS